MFLHKKKPLTTFLITIAWFSSLEKPLKTFPNSIGLVFLLDPSRLIVTTAKPCKCLPWQLILLPDTHCTCLKSPYFKENSQKDQVFRCSTNNMLRTSWDTNLIQIAGFPVQTETNDNFPSLIQNCLVFLFKEKPLETYSISKS